MGKLNRRQLCECGCGDYAKPGNKFINHHGRGKPILKPIPNHHLCECGKCDKMIASDRRFAHGHNRQDVILDEELKLRIKESNIETYKNPEIRVKMQGENNAFYGHAHKEEFCLLQKQRGVERFIDIEFIEKHSKATKEALDDLEVREKISNASLKNWQDSKYCEKQKNARQLKPNKPESIILYLLNLLFPGEWLYTGDFSFTINGKSPDFTNCNGQKKVIEFNGNYWHQNDISGEREAIFAKFGYDTLILSDEDLGNEDLLKIKLIEFHNKPNLYASHNEVVYVSYI